MRAVVLAYHNMGCAGVEAIAAIFTHPDDPNENLWFGSVAELAASKGIPVHAPQDINHPMWVERIRQMKPDILFSFYYRNMVGKELLAVPPRGCLNLHGSLLPRYRGRSPINWVLVNGETETGVTLHEMTSRPDDGDIVVQRPIAIGDDDTARNLMDRAVAVASEMLDETLPAVKAGTAPRTPQDQGGASYFGGRGPADGEIDWTAGAAQVRNLVRAVTRPYPGAFTFSGDRKILVWSATVVDSRGDAEPGTILSADPLRIACGRDALQIDFAQSEGGIYTTGAQLTGEMNLVEKMRLGPNVSVSAAASRHPSVLILGVNGFIGSALSERILDDGKYDVHGMDLSSGNIGHLIHRPGFRFEEGDISIHREWIEYHIRKCDIVPPGVDRVPHPEVRHRPAPGGHRHPHRVRAQSPASLRAGLRGKPEGRALLREIRQARDLPLHQRGVRHVHRRRVQRGPLEPGSGAHQQAAVDLLQQQAAPGPGDLGLREDHGAEVHPVPPLQLARQAAGQPGVGADRQLPGSHPAHPQSRGGHSDPARGWRRAEALLS
jgi:methionyl-tRNA formyltransferase